MSQERMEEELMRKKENGKRQQGQQSNTEDTKSEGESSVKSSPLRPVPFSNSENDEDYLPSAQPLKYDKKVRVKSPQAAIHSSQVAGPSKGKTIFSSNS